MQLLTWGKDQWRSAWMIRSTGRLVLRKPARARSKSGTLASRECCFGLAVTTIGYGRGSAPLQKCQRCDERRNKRTAHTVDDCGSSRAVMQGRVTWRLCVANTQGPLDSWPLGPLAP